MKNAKRRIPGTENPITLTAGGLAGVDGGGGGGGRRPREADHLTVYDPPRPTGEATQYQFHFHENDGYRGGHIKYQDGTYGPTFDAYRTDMVELTLKDEGWPSTEIDIPGV